MKGGLLKINRKCIFIVTVAVVLVVILAIIIGVAVSSSTVKQRYESNFVLLVSLDGFRSDYLNAGLTPTLDELASKGVSTNFMRSVFPTKTFPNHYSIVTGLYAESHGIVSNSFYDEKLDDTFKLGRPVSFEKKWWGGEPIWITAMKNGMKAASFFWVGSEAVHPTYWRKYNTKIPFTTRIKQVISWMKLEESKRPSLITLYFEQPDKAGHKNGPFSEKTNATVKVMDNAIKELLTELKDNGLEDFVNIVITSDHGMAPVNCGGAVYIEKMTNISDDTNVVGLGASSLLYTTSNEKERIQLYEDLKCSNKNLFAFSTKSRDTPRRMHYQNNIRIGDTFLMPELGASILRREGTCRKYTKGYHGIDNILREMQAIFVASGPDFKSGYKTDHFENIEVYNLLSDLLKIRPAPNNGTEGSLRHMLKPSFVEKLKNVSRNLKTYRQIEFPKRHENISQKCEPCLCGLCKGNLTNTSVDFYIPMNMTKEQVSKSQILHFPWSLPKHNRTDDAVVLLTQQNYITGYSTALHLPMWVGYKLTKEDLNIVSNDTNASCVNKDIRFGNNELPSCGFYEKSGYKMAPLAPIRDLNDSFIITNIVPQYENFLKSNGPWNYLQNKSLEYANEYGSIHVISGVIFDEDNNGNEDRDLEDFSWLRNETFGVAIPTHFYKIFIKCNNRHALNDQECKDQLDILVFILPHSQNDICKLRPVDDYVKRHVATLKDVELLTGIYFFTGLPYDDEMKLKVKLNTEFW